MADLSAMNTGYYDNSAAAVAAGQLTGSMNDLTGASLSAHRAISMLSGAFATPGFGRFSQQAAAAQQQLAGMRAMAIAAGQSMGTLQGAAERLAKSFPIGTSNARALVATIQSLGVTADKHSTQVLQLGTAFEKLGAATGENAAAVGAGLANLSRAFGDQHLDPARIRSMSDSLVVLKAQFGGSAQGILAFANAISPFARQAGLSEKATLGIAGAFQRLGDDSGAAQTAVSKMMADINQAMRDGGPQMQKYASIVGQTTSQFQQIYKSSPATALTNVVAALGKPGPQAQRELEQLGFTDSFRVQRTLAELTQSGGFAGAINASVNAAPGTADRASQAAMSGLNDSLGKLSSNSSLLAEKLGTTALGPLTLFANVMGKIVGGISDVAGSGIAQTALGVGGYLFGARTLMGRGIAGSAAYGVGRRVFQSDILAGARMGNRMGRLGTTDLDVLEESVNAQAAGAGRFGLGAMRARQAQRDIVRLREMVDHPDESKMSAAGMRAMGMALGARTGLAPGEVAPEPGIPVHQQLMNYGSLLYATNKDFGSGFINKGSGGDHPLSNQFWSDIKNSWTGVLTSPGNGGKSIREAVNDTSTAFAKLSHGLADVEENGTPARRVMGALGRRGGAVLSAGMSGAGFLGSMGMSMLGGPVGLGMMGLTGAGMLYSKFQSDAAAQRQHIEDFKASSISAGADLFSDALGRAAHSTVTFADQVDQASNKVGPNGGKLTMAQAMQVSDYGADAAAGKHFTGLALRGNVAQVTAELQGASTYGIDPETMQKYRQNLAARGFKAKDIQSILGGLNTQGGYLSSGQTGSILKAVSTKAGKAVGFFDFNDSHDPGAGSRKLLDLISQNIAQQYQTDFSQGGAHYADQMRRQRMNAVLSQAVQVDATTNQGFSTGTENYLKRTFSATLGVSGSNRSLSRGGNYFSAERNPQMGPRDVGDLYRSLSGPNAIPAFMMNGANAVTNGGLVTPFGNVTAASAKSQQAAIDALLEGAKQAGVSLAALSIHAQRAAANMVSGSPQQAIMSQVASLANQYSVTTAANQGTGLATSFNFARAGAMMQLGQGDDPAALQQRQQSAQAAVAVLQQVRQMYQQRIQAQIQYQTSSGRSAEDYHTQMSRSEQDFQTGRFRAQRDFNRQMSRMAEDAAHSMYDPYHRIGVEALYDSKSLLVNMGDQNQAMQQQLSNLARARQMGLSNASIQQLGLSDSQHAQELQELVSGSTSTDINRLNKMVQQRIKLAGRLTTDAGNLSYVRARQDFQTSMADQNADFAKANSRAEQDFAKQQGRMAQDLHNSFLSITDDWSTLQKNLNTKMSANTAQSLGVLTDDLTNFQQHFDSGGQQISNVFTAMAAMMLTPNPATLKLLQQALANPVTYTSSQTPPATSKGRNGLHGALNAAGSVVTGMRDVTVGEAGPEAIIPLDAGGMHIIRAIERYIGHDDMRMASTGAARTFVQVNTSNHYDHSVHIGKVESHADSRAFIKDMENMSRHRNLTETATKRH